MTGYEKFFEYLDASTAVGGDLEPAPKLDDPRIAESALTCSACPEQYEGQLRDGRFFYFRYRWGRVRLGVGGTSSDAIRGTDGVQLEAVGDALQGIFDSPEQRDALFTAMLDAIAKAVR